MKIKDGKAIWEEVTCWECEGSGKVERGVTCSRWGMKTGHKPCPECGGKGQHGHKLIGKEIVGCCICNGKGSYVEGLYDYDKQNTWQTLPFAVTSQNRGENFLEAYIGVGLCSVTDYGAHKNLSDEELIDKVKKELNFVQYCKFVSKEGDVAKGITINRLLDGYTITALF